MPSIQDWAARAAERIDDEYPHARRQQRPTTSRIAAIVATFAEPILKLLAESRREHVMVEDGVCYKATTDDEDAECTCGADAWNKRIEEVLR